MLDGRALNGQLVSLILAALDSIAVFSGKVTVVPVSGNTHPSFSDLEVMVAAAQPLGVQLCWRSCLWRLKLHFPIDSSGRGAIDSSDQSMAAGFSGGSEASPPHRQDAL